MTSDQKQYVYFALATVSTSSVFLGMMIWNKITRKKKGVTDILGENYSPIFFKQGVGLERDSPKSIIITEGPIWSFLQKRESLMKEGKIKIPSPLRDSGEKLSENECEKLGENSDDFVNLFKFRARVAEKNFFEEDFKLN